VDRGVQSMTCAVCDNVQIDYSGVVTILTEYNSENSDGVQVPIDSMSVRVLLMLTPPPPGGVHRCPLSA
jgi:nitrous oxide reductase